MEGPATVKKMPVSVNKVRPGKKPAHSSSSRNKRSSLAAWERVVTRETSDHSAKQLPVALDAFREKYGEAWLVEVLRDVWMAERLYTEGMHPGALRFQMKLVDLEPNELGRPQLMALKIGPHVFSSPSFWRDWWRLVAARYEAAGARDEERSDDIELSARRFLAAVLQPSFLNRPERKPRGRDPQLEREFLESQRIKADLEEKIAAAIARGEDDPEAAVTEAIGELGLQPKEAQQVRRCNLGTIARYVAIAQSRALSGSDLQWFRTAEDSLRHFRPRSS